MCSSDPAELTSTQGPAGVPASDRDLHDPWISAIGHTPLVPLRATAAREGVLAEIWGKVEGLNPTGSVKDRAAAEIVRVALSDGHLGSGQTLVDASSGNTAVAYAMLGARWRFPVRLFVPSNAHPERLARLEAFGAEVELTDAGAGTDGAQGVARELAASEPGRFFYADQYANPANPRAHYRTTGPELWRQSRGRLTHLVCGVGTGGTVSGTGRFLKEQDPTIEVVAVEPDEPMHGLEGLKHLPTARVPANYDPTVIDRTIRVATDDALHLRDRLGREEGLWLGPSSAAAVWAALEVGRTASGARVAVVLPDMAGAREGSPR